MKYMFVSLTLHKKQTVLWLLYLQQLDQYLVYNKPLVYIRWLITPQKCDYESSY